MCCKILDDIAGGESEVGGWRKEGEGQFFFLPVLYLSLILFDQGF
jgi:hypothetical protein